MRARKIRILLEVHPHIAGGVEWLVRNLAARMDRDRFEPVLLSLPGATIGGIFEPLGVRLETLDYRKRWKNDLPRLLRDTGIDVAQTNSRELHLALAARAAGVPHVWHAGNHVLPRVEGRDLGFALHSIRRLCWEIVCPSEFIRDRFRSAGVPARVIANGVDLDQIDSEAGLAGPGPEEAPPRVGMIAWIGENKRPMDFVSAAKRIARRFPKAEFHLFGGTLPGEAEYSRLVRRTIRRLGLQNRFRIRELRERRFEEYRKMTVFVLPSVREGFGIATAEAMALRKPVVLARSGGNAEVALEGKTGLLVPPRSPRALADAVIRLLSDPGLARRLGREGRRRVERHFDIRSTARKYERLWLEASASNLKRENY